MKRLLLLVSLVHVACAATPSAKTDDTAQAHAERRLEARRAQLERDKAVERARWTPEMHAAAKTLADATYPSGRTAIEAAVRGTHRRPGNADRDAYRHPVETLDFCGLTPTMTALEVDPGEGWYTEMLAPALASSGKLLATSDTGGAYDAERILLGEGFRAFLDNAPEIYGKVKLVTIDSSAPVLGMSSEVDMVLLMREVHGMVNRRTLGAWLAEIGNALKPGGVVCIEDHRAKAGADPSASAKLGYLPEQWTIDRFEAAGFKLEAKSEINANPRDTKDYPKGVWTLPPVYDLGSVDRARYAAIGESDRFTLKMVKR